jgi:CBS domain-containing protein
MRVRDVMTKNPAHLGSDATIFAAFNLLKDLDVRHLPIVDAEELAGILSDRDLGAFSGAELETAMNANSLFDLSEMLKKRVSDYMDKNVFFVTPESLVSDAIDLMIDQKIGAVPVVNAENTLVGIVSYLDILKAASTLFGDD